MLKDVKRRDFLNGMAIGVGASLLSPAALLARSAESASAADTAAQLSGDYYPPTLTGLRGSHPGSFEVAHALAWRGQKPVSYEDLDEEYDLVVVGAGFSGLAAARYYQKMMGEDARILILDNHDDFGGHAKRNEFHHNGRMVLNLGGAQMLEGLGGMSRAAKELLDELGINTEAMARNLVRPHAQSNITEPHGISLQGAEGRVTVHCNWLQVMHGGGNYKEVVRRLPIAASEQDKLIELFGGDVDYLDEMSLGEKYDYISTHSYHRFLTDKVGLEKSTIPLMDVLMRHYKGTGGGCVSVLESALMTPGIQGLGGLADQLDSLVISMAGTMEFYQFADGNASVARLLVHKLIPAVSPECKGFENIAAARFEYSALDRADHPVRLRLNSTVVGARENGRGSVEVEYVQKGKPLRIQARHCVLACYNGIIPHLCPQLPEAQKQALKYGVKVPFIYVNVLLDNGEAWSKLDMSMLNCPSDYFTQLAVAPPNSSGGFEPPRGPEDPMAILMVRSPAPDPTGDETARDLYRAGRHIIYSTPFETYESEVRKQLQSLLGEHGFQHERDIKAITVNRIPHGYAYGYNGLYDPQWPAGEAPHELGRKQFGRISIANSDSEAKALINGAFDAAWRAVLEQVL